MSLKTLPLALLLFMIFGTVSYAQSDRDRNLPDMPRQSESSSNYESPESAMDFRNDSRINTTKDTKSSTQTSTPARKENPIYKQGSDKEVRKESTSTLSFNLFLYVVDKFKED